MARIYMPRQRKSDMRYDYTVSSDEEGWAYPTGYCGGWRDPEEYNKKYGAMGGFSASEIEKTRAHRQNFHEDGHATAEEAEECYLNYQLDFDVRWSEVEPSRKCAVAECAELATWVARMEPFHRFFFCPAHQTRDDLKKAIKDNSAR